MVEHCSLVCVCGVASLCILFIDLIPEAVQIIPKGGVKRKHSVFALSRLTCKALLGHWIYEWAINDGMSAPTQERTFGSWLAEHSVMLSNVLGACYPDALRRLYSRGGTYSVM